MKKGLLVLLLASVAGMVEAEGKLKVFILAGQSNMEGHAAYNTIDHLGKDATYGKLLANAKPNGATVVRDDVYISWIAGRNVGSGKLTAGCGAWTGDKMAPGNEINLGKSFGPELGFGVSMGDFYEEPVLLIKSAWGGKALGGPFLPPSAGGPGESYTLMVEHTHKVLDNIKTVCPEYDGKGYDLVGFVWFQGWNDMCSKEFTASYAENLGHLIRDLRAEFKAPDMKVVVGELGAGGPKDDHAFRKAQKEGCDKPEFKGNVEFVTTAEYWDFEAQKKLPLWKDPARRGEFYSIASERPFHYLGSGKIMYLMGNAFGEGMKKMITK